MKQKIIVMLLLACGVFFISGCLDINSTDDIEDILKGAQPEEVDGSATSSQVDSLLDGYPITRGDNTLILLIDEDLTQKSFKLTAPAGQFYFNKTSSLSKTSAVSETISDIIGTWRLYKQIVDDIVERVKQSDTDKSELIVSQDGDGIQWEVVNTGDILILNEDEKKEENEQIQAEIEAEAEVQKAKCDAREDLTEAEKEICKARIDSCVAGQIECVELYNPCERADLNEEDKIKCEEKYDLCNPDHPDFVAENCQEHFDPCDDPAFTPTQRIECKERFEKCGPGGTAGGNRGGRAGV